VSIHSFLAKSDADAVVKLLDHQGETVRHNLLAWLVETFRPLQSDDLQSLIESSKLSARTKRDVIGHLTEYVKAQREGRFTAVGSPLFSYIPNLDQFSARR
jgi:hypothetical protein